MKKLLQLSFLLLPFFGIAQTTIKNLPAKRTLQKVVIDGVLNELAWKDAAKFDEMIEFRPTMGKKEEKGNMCTCSVLLISHNERTFYALLY